MEMRYHAMVRQDNQILLEHYLMSGGNYQFCWHKPLELMLVLKGTAEVFAGGRRYLLEQDDMLLINSNLRPLYLPAGSGQSGADLRGNA